MFPAPESIGCGWDANSNKNNIYRAPVPGCGVPQGSQALPIGFHLNSPTTELPNYKISPQPYAPPVGVIGFDFSGILPSAPPSGDCPQSSRVYFPPQNTRSPVHPSAPPAGYDNPSSSSKIVENQPSPRNRSAFSTHQFPDLESNQISSRSHSFRIVTVKRDDQITRNDRDSDAIDHERRRRRNSYQEPLKAFTELMTDVPLTEDIIKQNTDRFDLYNKKN